MSDRSASETTTRMSSHAQQGVRMDAQSTSFDLANQRPQISTNTGETSGNKENLRFHATSSVAKRAWSSLAVPRSSSGAASRSQEASAGAMNDQSADIIRASTEGYSVEVSAGRAHACAENSDVTTIETNPPLLGQRCVGPADGRTRNREYGRRAGSSRISTVPRVATTITSAQRRVTAPPPSARALRKRMSSPVGTCLQAYREVDGKCESSASGGIIRADGEGQEEHRLYSGAASGDAIGARRVRASLSSSSSSSSTSSSSRLNNIPSKLMQSTAASRAGMYTPPAGDSVRSRFVPKRRLSSPSMLSSSSPSSSSPTSSSACSVPHSQANVVVSERGSDRIIVRPAKKVPTNARSGRSLVSEGEGSERREIGSSGLGNSVERREQRLEGARAAGLMSTPPARRGGAVSQRLETAARRRARTGIPGRGIRGSNARRVPPRGKFPAVSDDCSRAPLSEDDDEDMLAVSPSFSRSPPRAFRRTLEGCQRPGRAREGEQSRGRGEVEELDISCSSLETFWSIASVDTHDRKPNAREEALSGGDPVARMLLDQCDDSIVTTLTSSPCISRSWTAQKSEADKQQGHREASSSSLAMASDNDCMPSFASPLNLSRVSIEIPSRLPKTSKGSVFQTPSCRARASAPEGLPAISGDDLELCPGMRDPPDGAKTPSKGFGSPTGVPLCPGGESRDRLPERPLPSAGKIFTPSGFRGWDEGALSSSGVPCNSESRCFFKPIAFVSPN